MSKVLQFPTRRGSTPPAPPTFKGFHQATLQGDTETAATMLSALLGTSSETATRAARHYGEALARNPDHMLLAMGLYGQVARADQNDVLLALRNVFGLSVAEAVPAYAHLRTTSAR